MQTAPRDGSQPVEPGGRPPFPNVCLFALFALTLGLIFNLLGYLPEHLRLLLIYALLLLPILFERPERRAHQVAALLAAAAANALVRQNPVFQVCTLLLAHFYVWTGYRSSWRACYPAVVFFAALYLFLFQSPQGFHSLHGLAGLTTGLYARLVHGPCNLGYTYQNLGSLILFLTLSLFRVRDAVSLVRSLCFSALLLLVTAAAIKFVLFGADLNAELLLKLDTAEPFSYRQYAEFTGRLVVLLFPGVLFLAHLALFTLFHGSGAAFGAPEATALRAPRAPAWLCGLLALLLAAALMPLSAAKQEPPRSALFYSKGVVSFTKPEYGNYGSPSSGMYGTFVDFVNLFGFAARVVDAIPDRLDEVELLVLTNLDTEMPADTAQRIWRFVQEGGLLWVLGDHTFVKNGSNHINELLKPCRIQLANDSAKHLVQGWFESYELRLLQPFLAQRNDAENSLSILVGASLEIQPPAEPIVVGRYGFSDKGTMIGDERGGNMGDYRYTRDEQLGDLVLVAGQPYGKGRVVVFGDTTSFFNGNTAKTYSLIRSVLTYLRTAPPSAGIVARMAPWAPYLLPPLLLLCVAGAPSSRSLPAVLGTFVVYSLIWEHHAQPIAWDRAAARGKLALVDMAHSPAVSKHALMPDAAYGLAVNAMRHGWLPVQPAGWDPEMLDVARCLFLISPQRSFSASEASDVPKFLDRGGSVIMTAGPRNAAAARALLRELGLDVKNIPLGRFFDREAFGHPVSFYSAWAVEAAGSGAEIVTAYDDLPLIVSRPRGKGRFILIGDPEFLLNKNLESDGHHDPNNIEFVRRLLDHVSRLEIRATDVGGPRTPLRGPAVRGAPGPPTDRTDDFENVNMSGKEGS
jgi:hypothetical protein